MGFMDSFLVSHNTWEVTERHFLMDESLYKGHLAWLLLIQLLHFDEDTSIFGTLQFRVILYMFEAIFCWYIWSKFLRFLFFSKSEIW